MPCELMGNRRQKILRFIPGWESTRLEHCELLKTPNHPSAGDLQAAQGASGAVHLSQAFAFKHKKGLWAGGSMT